MIAHHDLDKLRCITRLCRCLVRHVLQLPINQSFRPIAYYRPILVQERSYFVDTSRESFGDGIRVFDLIQDTSHL